MEGKLLYKCRACEEKFATGFSWGFENYTSRLLWTIKESPYVTHRCKDTITGIADLIGVIKYEE